MLKFNLGNMKKKLCLLFCLGFLSSGWALEIDKNSSLQIVVPDHSPLKLIETNLVKTAEMLAEALKTGPGCKVKVVKESDAVEGMSGIYLGNTREARKHGIFAEKYQNFSFTIQEKNGQIFIVGEDCHRNTDPVRQKKLTKNADLILGTVCGAVKFAEKFLNTRFLFPGDVGTDYDEKLKKVTVPKQYKQEHTPRLLYSNGENGLFYSTAIGLPGFGKWHFSAGHSHYRAVPVKKYGKTHPEYFALIGNRRAPGLSHLCISNPAVQELLYQDLVENVKGFDAVELGQTDGYILCSCKNCAAYGGVKEASEKLWILHRDIAKRMLRSHPEKTVIIIAYGPTLYPPRTFKEFPANVMVELSSFSKNQIAAWKNCVVPKGFAAYTYLFGRYHTPGMTPKRTPYYAAKFGKKLAELNIRSLHRCEYGECFGLQGAAEYIFSRAIENPDLDVKKEVEEFNLRAFREAGPSMNRFFELLYKNLEIFSRLEGESSLEGGAKNDSLLPNPRALLTVIYQPQTLKNMSAWLGLAMKQARHPKAKKRMELVKIQFDYLKNLAEICHLYAAYQIAPNRDLLEAMGKRVEERRQMLDKIFAVKGYPKAWENVLIFGHTLRKTVDVNGYLHAPITAPLNWNIKVMLNKPLNTKPPVAEVKKISGAVPVENLESGPWARIPWHDIGEISGGTLQRKSRFKTVYDDKKLYIAVESELPDSILVKPLGRDGKAYVRECIELMIDSGKSYCHMVVNPSEEISCYDEKWNPIIGKMESGWNGKWSYRNYRQNGKWNVVFEIPWSDLDAVKPLPGDVWRINIARMSYIQSNFREMLLWAPNYSRLTFSDKNIYGEFIFK